MYTQKAGRVYAVRLLARRRRRRRETRVPFIT